MNHIAVIDIGSNSVRYMESECTLNGVHSSSKLVNTTRLAEGQEADKKLKVQSMNRTVQAIIEYQSIAKEKGLPVYAYATSASREASNKDEFLSMLGTEINIKILSGEEEGKIAFLGISRNCSSLIDIGGGSLQVVTNQISKSYPIGCVRLADRMPVGNPEEMFHYLFTWAETIIDDLPSIKEPVIGIGGTITTLTALSIGLDKYDRDIVTGKIITIDLLDQLLWKLYDMGETRKNHPLLKNRHAVIIQGGTILKYLMQRLSFSSLICSDQDGMEGYAKLIFDNYK